MGEGGGQNAWGVPLTLPVLSDHLCRPPHCTTSGHVQRDQITWRWEPMEQILSGPLASQKMKYPRILSLICLPLVVMAGPPTLSRLLAWSGTQREGTATSAFDSWLRVGSFVVGVVFLHCTLHCTLHYSLQALLLVFLHWSLNIQQRLRKPESSGSCTSDQPPM